MTQEVVSTRDLQVVSTETSDEESMLELEDDTKEAKEAKPREEEESKEIHASKGPHVEEFTKQVPIVHVVA